MIKKTIFFNVCFMLFAMFAMAQKLAAVNLRCESRSDPLGVEVSQPKLNWQIQSNQNNVLQIAYRILVADDELQLEKNLGNVWDSRKINSAASIQVAYSGKRLSAAKKYFWKIMVWDNMGNASAWSAVSCWQMGLLSKNDWDSARWIAYAEIMDTAIIAPHVHLSGKKSWGARKDILPILRKEFSVFKRIKLATIFICGLGHFELSINGNKIGDHFLAPGWTNYSKHAQYVTYDITQNLKQGANAIGVILGNGFYYIPSQRYRKMTGAYGYPKLITKAIIEFEDGSKQQLISDESWHTDASPIIYSSIFGGEDYDANLYQHGWDEAGFDDHKWKQVVVSNGPELLETQMQEPVKVMEHLSVKKITVLRAGISMYDLGQNFSGVPSIKVKGNKGDTVRIYASELINPDGTPNQKASGSPSFFTYILNGKGEESWVPRFTYTGFRYLQLQCIPGDGNNMLPEVMFVEGLHIRNASSVVGSFECSNRLFNQTNELIDWAIKSNMVSVFTDCPHREKLGWLEQTHLMGASVHYNYDIAALNRKVINDMRNAQYADGKIPEISPEFTLFKAPFDESPEWGSAAIILPWYNYRWYGDKQSLIESYDMMKAYTMYLKSKAKDNILSHGLGDWFDIGPAKSGFAQMTKSGVTGTATFYYDICIMIKVATMLDKNADVQFYQHLASEIKDTFNRHFFDQQKMQYDSASQTANAMALYMGLVDDKNRQYVLDALIREIRKRNNELTAGDIGYRYVLKALELAGRSDIIYDMNYRDDVPGYGYQLKHGATALTESWQAYESVSNNHFMLGHLMEWFYAGLAGIKQSEKSIAYKEVEIKPQIVGDLKHAKASFQSPYGYIKSEWKLEADVITLAVEIPANSTAVIFLPAKPNSFVTVNGSKRRGVLINGEIGFKIGSGKYQFIQSSMRL